MDVAPFIPIIVEATKFVFGEFSKLIDHARQKSGKSSVLVETRHQENNTVLTRQEFAASLSDLSNFSATINSQVAEANAYTISGLVDQLKTHQKNLVDLEVTEAEYGSLTPQHIKRSIEREASAIIEKYALLKQLLEQVHRRRIELG